jgi:hypothetical protein
MESQLKREFDSKAVNRARNLVNKDFNKRTAVGTGYEKKREKHSEGDTWEEDGRTWTIKNGVKQNVTRLDSAKKLAQIPLTCPKCGGSMNHWLAKKMYRINGFCFDPCTVEMEADLRKAGLYEQYEKAIMKGNVEAWAEGLNQWIESEFSDSHNYVTEDGEVEEWKTNANLQKQQTLERLTEYLEKLREHLK